MPFNGWKYPQLRPSTSNKSIYTEPMFSPYFIDIEASGFGRGSYPIEIGIVNGVAPNFCHIVTPAEHWQHWDSGAESLHGIQRQMLLEQGMDMRELALLINQQFCGEVLYTDAWGNDNCWLGLMFDEVSVSPHFRLETIRKLLDEEQTGMWHSCKDNILHATSYRRHRASNDACILQMTYWQVMIMTRGYQTSMSPMA